jgi:hypothetical protein
MTLTLTLPPELEQRLTQEAHQRGVTIDVYALEVLANNIPTEGRRSELVTLLQDWIDQGSAEEHKETGEYLIHALDQDRLSDRKLFPPELKGVTW